MALRASAMEKRITGCLFEIERLAENGYLACPIGRLREEVGSAPTVGRHLDALEKRGYIKIFRGEGGRVSGLYLVKRESASVGSASVALQSAPSVGPTVAALAESSVSALVAASAPHPPGAVVLIDLENVMRRFEDAHRAKLSFKKLFEILAARFKPVYRWEVFVPPYIAADSKLVQVLREAGFTCLCLCPKGHKDKDSVDAVMMESGRYHARESAAGAIVIVSEDADFAPLANYVKSFGKAAETYGVSEYSELALEAPVQDAESAFYDPRELAADLQMQLSGVVLVSDGPRMTFLKRVADAVWRVEVSDGNNCHVITHRNFETLAKRVRELLPAMAEHHIKAALGVLKDAKILDCKSSVGGHKYYELTSTPALRRAVGVEVK